MLMILAICDVLYRNNGKIIANEICNYFISRGNTDFRTIFFIYNPST